MVREGPHEPYGFGVDLLCPFVRRPPVRSNTNRTLDPIKVAGAMDSRVLLNWWRRSPLGTWKWTPAIAAALDPATPDFDPYPREGVPYVGWCGACPGRYREDQREGRLVSSRSLEPTCEKLKEWRVLQELERREHFPGYYIYARLFTVDKGVDQLRVILDCRRVNAVVGKPPPLRLATLRQIAAVMRHFPKGFFITLDLRHMFHQIKLPSAMRRFFAVALQTRWFVSCTLPMGFSWAPAIAQCVSATLLVQALLRFGIELDADQENEDHVPPVLVFRRASSPGEIAVLAVIWYDNFLIATPNDHGLAEGIRRAFMAAANELHAVIKGEIEIQQSRTRFVGVDWDARDPSRLLISHSDENVLSWAPLVTEDPPSTPRELARILGVLQWDWQISGRSFAYLAPITSVARLVGKLTHGRPDAWDEPLRDLDLGMWQEVKARLVSALIHPPRVFETKDPPGPDVEKVFVVSDASKRGFGAIRFHLEPLKYDLLLRGDWQGDERDQHISWKETAVATRALAKLLRSLPSNQRRHVIFGTDNSAARWALEHGYSPLDQLIAGELADINVTLAQNPWWVSVVYVPTDLNAADGPSRGHVTRPSVAEVARCVEYLVRESTLLSRPF